MSNGWEFSAAAWIASIGERGGWGSGDASHQERFRRVPWFAVMEWRRPAWFNAGDPSKDGDPQINFFAEPG